MPDGLAAKAVGSRQLIWAVPGGLTGAGFSPVKEHTMKVAIPMNDFDKNEVFERDPVAWSKARAALALVREGKIDGHRFLRLVSNYKGEALARFARHCAEVAQHRLSSGWAAGNARFVQETK